MNQRTQFEGMVASSGMALGNAVHLPDFVATVPQRSIDLELISHELTRFEEALTRSELQIQTVLENSDLVEEHKAIFEAQMMLIRDPMLVDPTKEKIQNERINTEWALAGVLDSLKEMLRGVTDPTIRERVSDLEDIGNRIISNLLGIDHDDIRVPFVEGLPANSILIAENISPSLMLQMGRGVAGIVTEKGGVTGHMAILCRDRGIPAIVGAQNIRQVIPEGVQILLDCSRGVVIASPDADDRERYDVYNKELQLYDHSEIVSPVNTADGDEVHLWVNLDNSEDAININVVGVTGVGLFRTEFLYLKNPLLLEQKEEQVQMYAEILRFLKGKVVTFRLLDLGDDKTLHAPIYRYAGAATDSMSLRGIRFLLANISLMRQQIFSIVRAAIRENIESEKCRIMIPMVTRLEEIIEVRRALEEVRSEIQKETGVEVPLFPLGIMLETPAACLMADIFSDYVDFFSLGTNDLAQYTLALSRGESRKEDDQFFQPALYRMIRIAVEKAKRPVSVCGEIAGMVELIPVLVGLGIRNLSVSVSALQKTYAALSVCNVQGCTERSNEMLETSDAREFRRLIKSQWRD